MQWGDEEFQTKTNREHVDDVNDSDCSIALAVSQTSKLKFSSNKKFTQ